LFIVDGDNWINIPLDQQGYVVLSNPGDESVQGRVIPVDDPPTTHDRAHKSTRALCRRNSA